MAQKRSAKSVSLKRAGPNEWTFLYPRLSMDQYDELHEAIEFLEAGDYKTSEQKLQRLIKQYPEFIDAYHHLALILQEEGGQEAAAAMIWDQAVEIGLSCIPKDFYYGRDMLPWDVLENRPFLRAYYAIGLCYVNVEELERALLVFLNILDLNPNDNQGARSVVVDCCFRLKRPVDVLNVCERYPDDAIEHTVYGKPLALFN